MGTQAASSLFDLLKVIVDSFHRAVGSQGGGIIQEPLPWPCPKRRTLLEGKGANYWARALLPQVLNSWETVV
jgi:hypothetical protein